MLEDTELTDLELQGHPYTWKRGRNTVPWIEIRLDMALINNLWSDQFPFAKLYNMEGTPSDHSPIFLEPQPRSISANKKRFRFENAWLLEPLCAQIIKNN